jgi:hypothetical protein
MGLSLKGRTQGNESVNFEARTIEITHSVSGVAERERERERERQTDRQTDRVRRELKIN